MAKARESISLLKNIPQFQEVRREIWEYLSKHNLPSDLYKPKEYSKYFLKNFTGTVRLQTLKNQCDDNCKDSTLQKDTTHPQSNERRVKH